jgi:hypothetical protein
MSSFIDPIEGKFSFLRDAEELDSRFSSGFMRNRTERSSLGVMCNLS